MRLTVEQARTLVDLANRDTVQAVTFGMGTDGYSPPDEDVWVHLGEGRSVKIKPDGAAQ